MTGVFISNTQKHFSKLASPGSSGCFEHCSPFASSQYCNNMSVQNRIIQKGNNEKCITMYYYSTR